MGRLREGKKRKGERERKVGKLFCAPLLVSLKLGCTGLKVVIQRKKHNCNLKPLSFSFTPV